MKRFLPHKTLLFLLGLFALLVSSPVRAQIKIGDDLSDIDYSSPKKYEIAGITVEGTSYVDKNVLSLISGLRDLLKYVFY